MPYEEAGWGIKVDPYPETKNLINQGWLAFFKVDSGLNAPYSRAIAI
jgi:hypothetical protein